MRQNSDKVANGGVRDAHDESSKHDWVLPAGLMGDAVTTHWKEEAQECDNDGQHESNRLEDVACHQYRNEHCDRYRRRNYCIS